MHKTTHSFNKVFIIQDGKCCDCGKPLTQKSSTWDHIVPKSRGGSNKLRNLQLMCWDCNHKKADKILRLRPKLLPEILGKSPEELKKLSYQIKQRNLQILQFKEA